MRPASGVRGRGCPDGAGVVVVLAVRCRACCRSGGCCGPRLGRAGSGRSVFAGIERGEAISGDRWFGGGAVGVDGRCGALSSGGGSGCDFFTVGLGDCSGLCEGRLALCGRGVDGGPGGTGRNPDGSTTVEIGGSADAPPLDVSKTSPAAGMTIPLAGGSLVWRHPDVVGCICN